MRSSHTRRFTLLAFVMTLLMAFGLVSCSTSGDWRTASREPAGIAPDPGEVSEPVIHVYGASAWGWRGWFAIHTWISVKPRDAERYTVYEVIGWREKRGLPVLRISEDAPDRYWFGERPELLTEHRGEGVDDLIVAVDKAARAYPWKNTYKVFPGPNSNTFTAWVAQQVPQLELDLPFSAIGSGYIN
mgnify:CR=1 FL=1